MGLMNSAQLQLVACRENVLHPDEVVEAAEPQFFHRVVSDRRFFQSGRKGNYGYRDRVKYDAPVNESETLRILLVGNERNGQSIRITLSAHLSLAIDFFEARSGKLSLQVLDREAIDLIVFWEGIADMNGLEFLGQINQKFGKNKIPVIEILNPESAKSGVQAMKMGAHDYLIKNADGQHLELLPILVARIYTEKQTMHVLRHTAGVHQTITDSIPSVIYRLSLQGGAHDIRISPQILELGFSSDKWGNDAELHHQLCCDEDRPVVRKALENSYKTGTAFQCEYRINALGDTLRWFHDKAKVVMDKYGRPLFLQGVMTDISGIKSLEAEVTHYRDMLEKMVQQRTERLDRRVAILESCNSTLSDNYGKMHQRYLDLLGKWQLVSGEAV